MRPPETALVAALIAIACGPALALQPIEGRDGVAVEAILSIKEPTRIRIEGAPITDVFGNIFSSSCGSTSGPGSPATPLASPAVLPPSGAPAIAPFGELLVECDRDKGEIYVRPINGSDKPINLFVSTAQATYTLILRRADTPADTIVIRDRSMRPAGPSTDSRDPRAPSTAPLGTSAHHLRALKSMLLAMASDRALTDVQIETLDQPVQLWAEARFLLIQRYESRTLIGERYLLTNTSDKPMVLAEQEFDRPDSPDEGQVLAVAIDVHNLRPGETATVYVIRRGGQR